jgi:hypothetical protein
MTLRLNKDHRNSLKSLADKIIRADHESTNIHTAMFDDIIEQARKIVIADTPESDLKVLRKYSMIYKAKSASFVYADSSDVFNIRFYKDDYRAMDHEKQKSEEEKYCVEVPYRGNQGWNNRKIYQADKKLTELYRAYDLADNKYQQDLNQKLSKYFDLINHVTTFEALLSVWPEAQQLSQTFYVNLPSVITDEVIASIKAESTARMEKAAASVAPIKKSKK